jgi:hypothetical protein
VAFARHYSIDIFLGTKLGSQPCSSAEVLAVDISRSQMKAVCGVFAAVPPPISGGC